jgi:hypothetical protein
MNSAQANELIQACEAALPWLEHDLYTLIESSTTHSAPNGRPAIWSLDPAAKREVREMRLVVARLQRALYGAKAKGASG